MDILSETFTDRGERSYNEDSLGMALEQSRLSFILCDGLGGHGGGDVASSLVVEKMQESLESGMDISQAVLYAQNSLLARQEEEGKPDAMKTTLTCLSIRGDNACFAHVGDSRIYLFRDGKYKFRTLDHSVPQMLVQNGSIKEKDMRHHEDRSRLLRVMGTPWSDDRSEIRDDIELETGDSFLLCSDGFWEWITEKEMEKTLRRASTPKEWLDYMVEQIWENGRGQGMDNFSAIAVFIR